MSLDVTGERLVPEAVWGKLVHAEHLARYRFVRPLAAGRRVLDVACGEGYGAALLRDAGAASVVGVDLDAATVAHARERHGVDAQQADVAALPFEDAAFDLVVSFETIEHVADPERALAELRRVLAPEGLLAISTPNASKYVTDNEFHVREFEHDDFVAMLRSAFPHVTVRHQQNYLASAVLGPDALASAGGDVDLGAELVKLVGSAPGEELYVVALCGFRESPPPRPVAVGAAVHEAHELLRQRDELQEALHAWQERSRRAERYLADWTERAQTAERQVTESRDLLASVERECAQIVDGMTSSASWRVTAPLRSVMAAIRKRRASSGG